MEYSIVFSSKFTNHNKGQAICLEKIFFLRNKIVFSLTGARAGTVVLHYLRLRYTAKSRTQFTKVNNNQVNVRDIQHSARFG